MGDRICPVPVMKCWEVITGNWKAGGLYDRQGQRKEARYNEYIPSMYEKEELDLYILWIS